jgi:two-component system, NtrC family, sensor kinase
MPGEDRTLELERQLAARDKTIAVLTERLEGESWRGPPSLPVLEQNLALERLVVEKTEVIEAQRAKLAAALADLQRTQAQLLQTQKLEAIGQLASGIAHEINTPVQYVTDNTVFLGKAMAKLQDALAAYRTVFEAAQSGSLGPELLSEADAALKKAKLGYLLEQVPRAIAQSLEGLERVTHIVRAMKEFSHPSAGKKELVDIHEAIATTSTIARNEWKYVAELVTDFAPDMPLVPCLRDQLNQVFLNLIVNAAHAIAEAAERGKPEKGVITVRTRHAGDRAEISVSDTGTGIPEHLRNRIFEPFFTTKPVGRGTGQGLTIAYSVVVEKHFGTIDFESEVGQGTTFRVSLPLCPEDEEGRPG